MDEVTVIAPGINAKMNELQAAFGLLQLKYVNQAIDVGAVLMHQYRNNCNCGGYFCLRVPLFRFIILFLFPNID